MSVFIGYVKSIIHAFTPGRCFLSSTWIISNSKGCKSIECDKCSKVFYQRKIA